MAIAKKCDRCHQLYEQYPCNQVPQRNDHINGITTAAITEDRSFYTVNLIDLCPNCLKELKQWLDKFIDKPENSYIQTEFNEKINTDNIKIIDTDEKGDEVEYV